MFRGDSKIARKLMYEYQVVKVQAGDTDANQPLAERFGAEIPSYPFLTVLDASGRAVVHQETGSLEEGPKHDPAKVLAFLEQHQAPAQDAGEVLAAARKRAELEHKRLFVAFEAPW